MSLCASKQGRQGNGVERREGSRRRPGGSRQWRTLGSEPVIHPPAGPPEGTAPRRGAGPFGRLRAVALIAAVYAAALVGWFAFGRGLPGGRWLGVHLFTLGIVTNLILALSDHFARTLTHQGGERATWHLVLTNAGILALLLGIPNGIDVVVAVGATILVIEVMASYLTLRRLRKTALAGRFDWIVRMYERAHGAFVHGAILGALLGTGVLGGGWVLSARVAHLHVNVLGWAGLTLLATVVFFGPTVVRTRIEPGADARAARALPWGATALTVAVLALFASGAGGAWEVGFRLLAAAGLAVFAWCVVEVCVPVVRAVLRSNPSAGRTPVAAAAAWFVTVAVADVVVVAAGAWRYLDALGAAMLAGVLFQSIAATLGYLAPLLRAGDRASQDAVRGRLERFASLRGMVWNLGVALVAMAAATHLEPGPWLARTGWTLVVAAALVLAVAVALPVGSTEAER
jgi:hypothetical protein